MSRLFSRAQVSRITGTKSPNLERKYPEFFAAGQPAPRGKQWTEEQVVALCEAEGIAYYPSKADPA